MVSKARDDLPDPDSPVSTMSLSRGSSRLTLRRLCSRAPRITRRSDTRAEPIWSMLSSGGTSVRCDAWCERCDGPSLGRLAPVVRGVQTIDLAEIFRRVARDKGDRADVEVAQALCIVRQPIGRHREPPVP